MRFRLLATALLIGAPLAPPAAQAITIVPIAEGTSPTGVRWTAKAFRTVDDGRIVFRHAIPGRSGGIGDYVDLGPRLKAGCLGRLGTARFPGGYRQITGPVGVAGVWLSVQLADGSEVTSAPQPAPRRVRAARAYVRDFRWASVFVGPSQKPLSATLYDKDDNVLTRWRLQQGVWLCPGQTL